MFKSVDHALRFAFKHLSSDIVKMSSINSMRGSSGSGELTPHDRHAQAALIVQACERVLDPYEVSAILCRYSSPKYYVDSLVPVVIAQLGTGVHSRNGVRKILLNYFGNDVGIPAIRAALSESSVGKLSDYRIKEYKKIAYDAMEGLIYRAEAKLDEEFIRCGMIIREFAQEPA